MEEERSEQQIASFTLLHGAMSNGLSLTVAPFHIPMDYRRIKAVQIRKPFR
jgi:hypothetical protein